MNSRSKVYRECQNRNGNRSEVGGLNKPVEPNHWKQRKMKINKTEGWVRRRDYIMGLRKRGSRSGYRNGASVNDKRFGNENKP